MWAMQVPVDGAWFTVMSGRTEAQVAILRQANIDVGYVEDVDFRFIKTS